MTNASFTGLAVPSPDSVDPWHASMLEISSTIGTDFFRSLVKHLANGMGAYCVYIGELVRTPQVRIRTIGVYENGGYATNFEFEPEGTAAGEVIGRLKRVYRSVLATFPSDPVLKRMNAETFIGIPLISSDARVLGLIGLIFRRPLGDIPSMDSMLGSFASRASAEMERQQREQAIRESEQRYRAFIAASTDAMWRVEFEEPIDITASEEEQIENIYRYGYLAECNQAAADLLGAPSPKEAIGMRVESLAPRSDSQSIEQMRSIIRAGHGGRFNVIRTDKAGNVSYRLRSQWGIVEDGKLKRLWMVTRDITELKRTEEALRKSEALFRNYFEMGLIGMAITSPQRTWIAVNERLCEMLGYSHDEMLAKSLDQITDPRDLDRDLEEFHRIMSGQADTFKLQKRLLRKDGRTIFADVHGRAVRDPSGAVEYLIEHINDITEQKEAELALQASEQRMRDLLEGVHLLALIVDPEGKVLFCNDYLLELTGWTRSEVIGRDWFALILPEHEADQWRSEFQSELSNGEAIFRMEAPLLTKSGSRRLISWDCLLQRGPRGEVMCLASIGRDVTEERAMEARLRQTQRLESIGRLAGGIAHDFNNVLTVIQAYTDLMQHSPNSNEETRTALAEVAKACESGVSLTQQLMRFSRSQPMQARILNLNTLISENEPMLRFAAGKRIEWVTELDPELALVSVDPGQMQQVLLNLTLNARDAMQQVGKLTIRTRNLQINDAEVWPGVPAGAYVLLEVIDTGCGMPEEIRSRVFEPFFTTKSTGKGTGLGLSIVYGTVTQSKGYISVESTPGEGARFEILLPAAQAKP